MAGYVPAPSLDSLLDRWQPNDGAWSRPPEQLSC
jgi:hypothetical protein